MDDLFSATATAEQQSNAPLADRMRPRTLDEVLGQDHIVGPGRLLRRAIQADRLSSLIFYGPPGTGKTSLARVIANSTRSAFESMNAVLSGVKDVRDAIDRADERRRLYGQRTILFVDEVHRWNKAQQDALLPWVENGTVILIGATTENPFFEVNRALVSRSRVFQLLPLTKEDLMKAARRALQDRERGYGRWQVRFEEGALEHLVEVANGDARSLLNALELAVETTPPSWPPPEGSEIFISLDAAEQSIQKRVVLYDKDGDYHFDTISAFIKSLRGSDPDAALYWLARMVRAGEDPDFIFRRMLILASEDVGLADPQAITVVNACAQAFDRIGLPEGYFPLAEAALYLATAPKSNSALAFFDALKEVETQEAEVPTHLKDGSRDKEGFGHGQGYLYPHAYRDHWVAQQYLPRGLQGRVFYTPSTSGYEASIRDQVLSRRELVAAMALEAAPDGATPEGLSWAAATRDREGWYKRIQSNHSSTLIQERDILFSHLTLQRHHRVLVAAADTGLLLWEAHRRTPEGLTAGIVRSEEARKALLQYGALFGEEEQPRLMVIAPAKNDVPSDRGPVPCYPRLPSPEEAQTAFDCATFDAIIGRDPWRSLQLPEGWEIERFFSEYFRAARDLLDAKGTLVLLQPLPSRGQRLAELVDRYRERWRETPLDLSAQEAFTEAEASFWAQTQFSWGQKEIEAGCSAAGFSFQIESHLHEEERLLTDRDLKTWFNVDRSSWGRWIGQRLPPKALQGILEALKAIAAHGPVLWRWESILLIARRGK